MSDNDETKLQKILAQLKPHIVSAGCGNLNTDGMFRCIARAAIVKAFEFSVSSQKKHLEPFFLTATLRGICEDLIVLSYISSFSDRDDIVAAMNDDNLAEGLSRQRAFFGEKRPWQPIITDAAGHRKAATEKLATIAKTHGWSKAGRDQLPSVRAMAVKSNLESLYDFFYSATSKWVHCSPHILLRMGWSEPGTKHHVTQDTDWTYSTQNFTNYYADFNRIYSLYLLILLGRKFIEEFIEKKSVAELLDQIGRELDSALRWPELVTHEELNLDVPGPIMRILMRSKSDL